MTAIIVEREGIGHSAAREDEALLPGEVGDLSDPAERLRMRAAGKKVRLEQLGHLLRRDRTIADASGGRLDLDERLEPEEAARSGAHDRNVEAAAARLIERSHLRRRLRRPTAPKNRRERRRARSLRFPLGARDDRVDAIAVEAADRFAV